MEQFDEYVPGMEPQNEPEEPVAAEQSAFEPAAEPGYFEDYTPYESFPPKKPHKEKKTGNGGNGKKILCGVLAAVIFLCSCLVTAGAVNARWEKRYNSLQKEFETELDRLETMFDSRLDSLQSGVNNAASQPSGSVTVVPGTQSPGLVYQQNVDSVVQVSSQITTNSYFGQSTGTATGSGFVLSENGYVVTNYHVVQGAVKITFTTSDETVYDAVLVGYDDTNDVALLKAEASGLQAAKLGSSDTLVVGDQVVAIGYPLSAQEATLTVGYVSAKNRDVTTSGVAINMIQTDAAINSGNSGGPLFNMNGEVIGITTAKYSGTTSSGASIEGIGFAIPLDDVTGILSDLMTYGYVNSAYLGVMVRDMTETEIAAAQLYSFPVGVYVSEVVEGNCAKAAGVQVKDIIIDLGGYEIENTTDLTRALRKFQGGDETTITVFRSGKEVTLNITLDQKVNENQTEESTTPTYPGEMPSNGSFQEWYDYFFGQDNG